MGVWIKWTIACLLAAVATAQQPETTQAANVEYRERQLGPFNLEGRSYHLALREAVFSDGQSSKGELGRTAVDIWLRDTAGRDLFQRTFPVRQRGHEFRESVSVTAHLIQGRAGAGLLLTYHTVPSAPLGGESWRVFGVRNGELAPMSRRIVTAGKLDFDMRDGIVHPDWKAALSVDTLRLKVWTGYCFVMIPLKLDWKRGVMVPTTVCGPLQPPSTRCRFPTESYPQRPVAGKSVELYKVPGRGNGRPTVVTLSPMSEIEVLQAEVAVTVTEAGDDVLLSVGDDLWLNVRVDDDSGWMTGWEDLTTVGLPPAG